ncbi:MAG: 23S rRNA (uracil(1939)-C(5))-methyltransferase RlmD, partial [Firmicutes bacterium]|nr:23S rRNA (uracil(1939)-C(5))-methyltransferase RlmD [Bacillota bacterium]
MDIKLEVCKHDEYCGGCIYQGKEYGEQLAIKEGQVKEYIKENELLVESLDSIEPTPARYRYRNKKDYTFGDLVKDG